MHDQCVAVAPDAGMKIATEESYGPRDSDITPQLDQYPQQSGRAGRGQSGFGQGPAIVTRNYRQLGINCRSIRAMALPRSSLSNLPVPQPKACGLPAAALLIADKLPANDPQKPVVVNYSQNYQPKTKQAVSTFGGHAYDGLMILVEAMQRAKSADQGQGSRRDREDQRLHRHRRHCEHVADRSFGPRPVGVSYARDQGRRLDAGPRHLTYRRGSSPGAARSAAFDPSPEALAAMAELLQFAFSGLTVAPFTRWSHLALR